MNSVAQNGHPFARLRYYKTHLALLSLEDRIAPVAGAGFVPASMVPGDGNFEAYSGVVRITANGGGSGSLIQSADASGFGSFILTAAHVPLNGNPATVQFDLNCRPRARLIGRLRAKAADEFAAFRVLGNCWLI